MHFLIAFLSCLVLANARSVISCDVVIVGGGLSGLAAADALSANNLRPCVFEKENRWGGRYLDVFYPSVKEPIGLGGWRVDQSHTRMWKLINSLQITTIPFNNSPTKWEARGVIAKSEDELKQKAFPSLVNVDVFGQALGPPISPQEIQQFPDLHAFLLNRVGQEGLSFMQDDFGGVVALNNIDPRYFVEALTGPTANLSRPLAGMTAITNGLVARLQQRGVKMYLNQTISKIIKLGRTFTVTTTDYTVISHSLILSPTPLALQRIQGNIVCHIIEQGEFKSINPTIYFKGGAVYASAWWEPYLLDLQLYRSSTSCLGSILPSTTRGTNGEALIHHVYGGGSCATSLWDTLVTQNKTQLDFIVKKKLQYLFPNVTVPDPLLSAYHYWEDGAVHSQRPGYDFTLPQIQTWAISPLGTDTRVYLVGESYAVQRDWGEGALQTVANALLAGWNIQL